MPGLKEKLGQNWCKVGSEKFKPGGEHEGAIDVVRIHGESGLVQGGQDEVWLLERIATNPANQVRVWNSTKDEVNDAGMLVRVHE
jgi:hypothetical protein